MAIQIIKRTLPYQTDRLHEIQGTNSRSNSVDLKSSPCVASGIAGGSDEDCSASTASMTDFPQGGIELGVAEHDEWFVSRHFG